MNRLVWTLLSGILALVHRSKISTIRLIRGEQFFATRETGEDALTTDFEKH
jgi:hypothetical protein